MGEGRERFTPREKTGGLNADHLRPSIKDPIAQPPAEIPWEKMGIARPEDLLGAGLRSPGDKNTHLVAFRDDGDKEKFTVPKRLEKSFKDLASDDYETRQKASEDLGKRASLRELVDLRNKVPGVDLETARRLDRLIEGSARQAWEKFSKDPKKSRPDLSDPKVVDTLLKHAPPELKEAKKNYEEFRKFLFDKPLHTAKEYKEGLGKLDRVAAYSDWVDKAAGKEGASKETKDLARDLKQRGVGHYAKAWAGEMHERLANPDAKFVSDAKDIPQKDREAHAQAARQNYLDMVKSKDYSFYSVPFARQTERFLNDKTVPDKMYNDTIKKLTDKTLTDRFDTVLYQDGRRNLMMELGLASKEAPAARAKELGKQYDRLSADLEKRVAGIEDPKDRLFGQEQLVFAYHNSGRSDKAKAMYAKALKTVESLPEDERKRGQASLERWKKVLEKE